MVGEWPISFPSDSSSVLMDWADGMPGVIGLLRLGFDKSSGVFALMLLLLGDGEFEHSFMSLVRCENRMLSYICLLLSRLLLQLVLLFSMALPNC